MSRVHHGETPTRNNHTTVGQILRALPEGRKKVAVYLCNEDGEHWARRRRGRLEVFAERATQARRAHAARQRGLWRAEYNGVTSGWMFPSQRTKLRPITNVSFSKHVLRPLLVAAGLPWRGLYACRRSTGTILRGLYGNLAAAQQVLRHDQMATTDKHYALPSTDIADRGLKLLDSEYLDAATTEDGD